MCFYVCLAYLVSVCVLLCMPGISIIGLCAFMYAWHIWYRSVCFYVCLAYLLSVCVLYECLAYLVSVCVLLCMPGISIIGLCASMYAWHIYCRSVCFYVCLAYLVSVCVLLCLSGISSIGLCASMYAWHI